MTQARTSAWGWLLITVSTAGAPPALRVQVWRRLRALGALYLQQSVCLLPDRPEFLDRIDPWLETQLVDRAATHRQRR